VPVLAIVAAVLVLLVFKGSKAGASASAAPGAAPVDSVATYSGGSDALDNIAQAIYQFEGGHPGNINVRNNNPGNLRGDPNAIGKSGGYAVFGDQGDGWDALYGWLTRQAQTHPGWDFYDLFSVYAPSSDNNDPDAYAEYVANYAGFDPSQTVSSALGG
jgi:hypothetical protein